MSRGGHRHVLVLLPCLREKMKAVNATIEGLAKESGVSVQPIQTALTGNRIRKQNALCLYEALNTRKFSRSKCGAKL